jgi:anti-repressor protein
MNNTKNAVQVFSFEGSAKIRTVTIGSTIWFVAKDICDALGLSNSRVAISSLDEDEKGVRKVYTLGGAQESTVISESGLYALVIRSNKPNARRFRKWITSEVLPSIRRTGKYEVAAEPEEESLIVAKAFSIIHRQLTESKALIEKLEKQIEEDAPSVKFAKDLLATQNGMSIGEAAKLIREATGIELGQNRFYCYLLDRGYLHKGGSQRGLPVQRCIETGILSIGIRVDGTLRRDVTQVTAKGLQYFIRRFNRDREFLNFLYPEGFAK